MSLPDRGTIDVIRQELERACKDFSSLIAPLGFVRTKKMFWTRQREFTVDVIMFHRRGSTYGAPIDSKVDFRVHFAIRALNDSSEVLALNGPFSDPGQLHAGRYHLSFNAKSGYMYDRCLADLVRFVEEVGETWFRRFSDPKKLICSQDTPLQPTSAAQLSSAMTEGGDAGNIASSLKLLGIKENKPYEGPA